LEIRPIQQSRTVSISEFGDSFHSIGQTELTNNDSELPILDIIEPIYDTPNVSFLEWGPNFLCALGGIALVIAGSLKNNPDFVIAGATSSSLFGFKNLLKYLSIK